MIAPSTPKGDGCVEEGAAPAQPLSPFNRDGFCPSCLGYGEHFAFCEHATWERRAV